MSSTGVTTKLLRPPAKEPERKSVRREPEPVSGPIKEEAFLYVENIMAL